MNTYYVLILLFGNTGAQVIEVPSADACLKLKTYAIETIIKKVAPEKNVVVECFPEVGGKMVGA